jgi:rRNA maturation endonuclease Nob1
MERVTKELVATRCSECNRDYRHDEQRCPNCGGELERIWRDIPGTEDRVEDL